MIPFEVSQATAGALNHLQCGYETWSTIWGDPILSSTVLMLGYGVAAFALISVSRSFDKKERRLWVLAASILILLLINTHLDLQAFVWSVGRCMSQAQGWYNNRHSIQLMMIAVIGALIVVVLLLALLYFRRNITRNIILISGLAVVIGMTLVEAVDYKGLEPYYARDFGYFEGDDLIELFGIAIVLAAVLLRRRGRSAETT